MWEITTIGILTQKPVMSVAAWITPAVDAIYRLQMLY